MNREEFIVKYKDAMARCVIESFPPALPAHGERWHSAAPAPRAREGAGRRYKVRGAAWDEIPHTQEYETQQQALRLF